MQVRLWGSAGDLTMSRQPQRGTPPVHMYTIETSPFGFKVTMVGRVTEHEAMQALLAAREALKTCKRPFGVLVDIRTAQPLADEVQALVDETQRVVRYNGLQRSAVVLASAVMTMQFMRIASDTGVYAHERYLDASRDVNWEITALRWIIDGVDPDRHSRRPPR
jgi:hypothetical protein